MKEEKQGKLDFNCYSSYTSNSKEEGKFVFENIYVEQELRDRDKADDN